MIQEHDSFFHPFVQQEVGSTADNYRRQLARELLLKELEAELVTRAHQNAAGYQAVAVKAVAHRLHNLVLRHPTPPEWSDWLSHEIKRKGGHAKALLEEVDGLLSHRNNDVIDTAIMAAADRAARYSVGSPEQFPLREAALHEFAAQIRIAALRFYLAHLLERLTL